jgi:hypothetical protein
VEINSEAKRKSDVFSSKEEFCRGSFKRRFSCFCSTCIYPRHTASCFDCSSADGSFLDLLPGVYSCWEFTRSFVK